MLLSTVIRLEPLEPVKLPVHLGRAAHAWFLKLALSDADPVMAALLHDQSADRPFTVSDVLGGHPAGANQRWFRPGEKATLRITTLTEPLTRFMLRQKQRGALRQIRLGGGVFQVREMFQDASGHPWAGMDRFETLLQKYWEPENPPASLSLRFASPTVFRSNQVYLPLPVPRLVFEGLYRRWNRFALQEIPEEFLSFAADSLVIRDFQIRSRRVHIKKGDAWREIPGFVGACTFGAVVPERYWLRWTHLLAAFALYAGVGKNTAMGLGQTRLLAD